MGGLAEGLVKALWGGLAEGLVKALWGDWLRDWLKHCGGLAEGFVKALWGDWLRDWLYSSLALGSSKVVKRRYVCMKASLLVWNSHSLVYLSRFPFFAASSYFYQVLL